MSTRFQRISADEALHRAGDRVQETPRGPMLAKTSGAPSSWNEKRRSARFVMSTQDLDRYGDVVVTAGIDTTQFERNPICLLFHENRSWPVGSWANVRKITSASPARLEGDCVLLPAGGPVAEVDEAAWMIANGGIGACSIGFIPDWEGVEMIIDQDGGWTGGLRFNQSELVECSLVPVPANSSALVKGVTGLVGRMTSGWRSRVQSRAPSLGDIVLTPDQQEQARAQIRSARRGIEAAFALSTAKAKVGQATAKADASIARSRIRSILGKHPAKPATASEVAHAKREAADTRARLMSSLSRIGSGR